MTDSTWQPAMAVIFATFTVVAAFLLGCFVRALRRNAYAVERPDRLPSVRQASDFDASEMSEMSECDAPTYCPTCWLQNVNGGSMYYEPAGVAFFCGNHAYSTLHEAMQAHTFEQTGKRVSY